MLALRENRLIEAKTYLKKVLEKRALDPLVLADLGQTYFMGGEYEEALGLLEPAVRIDAGNFDGRLFLGRTQLALKNYADAQNTFERLYADEPEYSEALYYLGEAFDKQGKKAEAHFYLGLYCLEAGDSRKAVFNLKRARMESVDEELLEKIDEALRGAEEKEKERKKKEKEEREKQEEREEDSEGDQQWD
jgi:predicted Zn-dependent protease